MKVFFLAVCLLVISGSVSAKDKNKPSKWDAIKAGVSIIDSGVGIVDTVVDIDKKLEDRRERMKTKNNKTLPTLKPLPSYTPPPLNSSESDKSLANEFTTEALKNANTGNHSLAISLYQKAITADGNNWLIWHKYAWSLLKLNQFEKAESAYRKAITLGGNEHTWVNLGRTLMEQHKKHEAKKCFEKAFSLNRSNSTAKAMITRMNKEIVNDAKNDIVKKNTVKQVKVTYTVRAQPSLSLRSSPTIQMNNKVGQLMNGSSVKLIKFVSNIQKIDGKNGRWAQVEQGSMKGYVFSAYLTK